MKNISGPPVEGENFFGRCKECQEMSALLENHDVLLLGPRRTGKTSIARKIMAGRVKSDWRAIEVNVASCTDEKALLEKMAKAMAQEFASVTGKTKITLRRWWQGRNSL